MALITTWNAWMQKWCRREIEGAARFFFEGLGGEDGGNIFFLLQVNNIMLLVLN